MKQNVSETESSWRFRKIVYKNMSTKQEIVPAAAFKECHFHVILILLEKMVELPQQHANTTVHWL